MYYTNKLFLLSSPVTWLNARQGPYKMADINKIYQFNLDYGSALLELFATYQTEHIH